MVYSSPLLFCEEPVIKIQQNSFAQTLAEVLINIMINSINYEGGGKESFEFVPGKIQYTLEGVPILSAKQIENVATELLRKYFPHVLQTPSVTPVVEIIQKLHKRTGLLFKWDDLGYVGSAKVLGKVSFSKKTLYLDSSLES